MPVVLLSVKADAYLARLKVILHAVLEPLAFGLEGCHNQAVAHKVCRVADAFAGAEAVSKKNEKKRNCQDVLPFSLIPNKQKFSYLLIVKKKKNKSCTQDTFPTVGVWCLFVI